MEYLYQNGGKLTAVDELGKGCLHYAAMQEDPGLVMMLLKRGVEPGLKDVEGRDAVKYALDQENGDMVTM